VTREDIIARLTDDMAAKAPTEASPEHRFYQQAVRLLNGGKPFAVRRPEGGAAAFVVIYFTDDPKGPGMQMQIDTG
jgi:hypothetical protein